MGLARWGLGRDLRDLFDRCCHSSAISCICCRWMEHKDYPTMMACLKAVETRRPLSGIIENVPSIAWKDGTNDWSALDFILGRLQEAQFLADFAELDLNMFHAASRKRTAKHVSVDMMVGITCLTPDRLARAVPTKERERGTETR